MITQLANHRSPARHKQIKYNIYLRMCELYTVHFYLQTLLCTFILSYNYFIAQMIKIKTFMDRGTPNN